MHRTFIIGVAAIIAAGAVSPRAGASRQPASFDRPEWVQPVTPFKIIDNIYYVGTADLGSYLITTRDGHALLDTVVAAAVPQIEQNIAALGFKLADVKFLLNTQAHYDHAAGFAPLKAKSGATMVASEKDAEILERGGRDDPVLGNSGLFTPVQVDKRIVDGEEIRLGGVTMTARITAGHTPGATTWLTQVHDAGRTLRVVFPASLTVLPQARLAEPQSYPGMANDYARSLAVMKALSPDVFLGAHDGMFGLRDKLVRLINDPSRNPFIDPDGYRRFIALMEQAFRARLARDRKGMAR